MSTPSKPLEFSIPNVINESIITIIPGADFTLHCSDGIDILIYKESLREASPTMKNLLEFGTHADVEFPSSVVVEVMRFVHRINGHSIYNIKLSFDHTNADAFTFSTHILAFVFQYEIKNLLDHIEEVLCKQIEIHISTPIEQLIMSYKLHKTVSAFDNAILTRATWADWWYKGHHNSTTAHDIDLRLKLWEIQAKTIKDLKQKYEDSYQKYQYADLTASKLHRTLIGYKKWKDVSLERWEAAARRTHSSNI